jgi:hypothetical protein
MILDFQNNGAVVLTTPEPGAFLNFRWESGDGSTYLIPNQTSDISSGMLWVNGLDISQEASIYYDSSLGYAIKLGDTGDPSVASFFLYTRELGPFDANLKINVFDGSEGFNSDASIGYYDVSILNRPYVVSSDSINIYETSNVQVEGDTSYLILRTNPKFSGNIKLIIDPSNNLYMDTFKVSDILSNKLFRKQQISANSVFSGDIRTVFSSMPLGEMYRLDAENTLDIAIPKTDLYSQYNLNYSYGARLFEDELYEEDYAMLAPLWINNTLPDYFAIFRVPGVFNEETYEDEVDLTELAEKFLEEGELMESWGIKEKSPLGIYLRNHLSELQSIIAPMFLSLSDPDLKDPDPNTWFGVAIDKGIMTGRSETTYFFDQKSDNFTDLNAFSSGGFERLNLLCPNLINMEYVFNDNDVSLYTMQRYYGLYLTENPLYEIAYYASDPDGSVNIISLDGRDSEEFFSSPIFDSDGSIATAYQNRLFTLDDLLSIQRITNVNQVDGLEIDYIEEWLNKPGENIFSIEIEKINNLLPFISFELKNPLTQGDSLRIIDDTTFTIWEIYGIDIDILAAGESWTYATEYSETGYPTIYRTAFSVKGNKEDQNNAIWAAWNVFQDYVNTPFETYRKKTYGQSLILKEWAYEYDIKFQRLTAQTTDYIFDPSTGAYDSSSNFNSAADYGDVEFYGILTPTEDHFERVKYDSSYGPINFELYGDRMSLEIDIFDPSGYSVYSMDASITELFLENMLYLASDNWYRLVEYADVSTTINNSLRYLEDPTTVFNKIVIITEDPIITVEGKWNAYEVYPLTISLMGINPVKDFDYTVYDSSTIWDSSTFNFKSEYWYKREDDASTFSIYIDASSSETIKNINSFQIIEGNGQITINGDTSTYSSVSPASPFIFNTFDGSAFVESNSATVITYAVLDGSTTFKSYIEGESEEYIEDYYQDSSILLKYGLTVPTVTKWVGMGNDCRNNPLRLILDISIFDVSTNFIPYGNALKGELFYPSFKYLTPGDRNWEDYLFFDINDSIQYIDDSSTIVYSSFKELMFSDPELDIFSKLVYSNNADGTKLRSSIAYYNNFKNTVDVLVNGLNLSFQIVESARNIINIQDWDRYRISAIAIPSRNRDNKKPMEIFINENTETILIVWYQGNDILNYNYRYSSTIPGKGVLDPSVSSVNSIQWRGFENTDPYYSHVKTPFGVNNASISSNIFNIYGTNSTYDGSIASPFLQTNLNFGDDLFSIFNAYSGNDVTGSSFRFYNRSYDTFRQYVNYDYLRSDSTYGDNIANMAYSYMRNRNLYKSPNQDSSVGTCYLDTLQSILTLNRVQYYIFRGDTLYTSDSFTTNPVRISINTPRTYNEVVTYNGWYRPKFNNILNFSYNEEKEIIDIVQKDFIFGNTDLRTYSNIPQLWYNKVVDQVTAYDVSVANAINYKDSWNPFLSQWDADYYTLNDSSVLSFVDGYNSTLELPSYFGSKLVNLPESLILDSWESTTTDEDFGPGRLSISYNLTRSIINTFKNNDTFIENWADLTESDNVINGYIKKTILNYYNISKPKMKVEIWRKIYTNESSRIANSLDSSFKKWEGSNIKGVLGYINSEYIYTISVNLQPDYVYFVQFTLFEK